MKEKKGLRQFLRRGLAKVRAETAWGLPQLQRRDLDSFDLDGNSAGRDIG